MVRLPEGVSDKRILEDALAAKHFLAKRDPAAISPEEFLILASGQGLA